MTTITFDTHAFIKKLTESGLTEQQAEAITELQKETVKSTLEQARHEYELDNLATKRDLRELELRLEARIKDTELKIVESKAELVRWVVGVGILQTALIAALLIKLSVHV